MYPVAQTHEMQEVQAGCLAAIFGQFCPKARREKRKREKHFFVESAACGYRSIIMIHESS